MTPDARQADAVVVGAGMAGLSAAHALVSHGVRPVVLEASGDVGGLVVGDVVGGHEIDLGAEAFALRRPDVRELAESLGLPVETPAGRSWVYTADATFPIPAESVLGIPADPADPEVVAALGPDGASAAAQDLRLGADVGAGSEDLADLVRRRMGEAVLDRLVRPVAGGIHSADPADLAVDSVIPGLRDGLARHGSLSAAVRALRAAAPAGPTVATTTGGLFRLPRALAAAVRAGGGRIRTRAAAARIVPGRGWEVEVRAGDGGPARIATSRLIVATDGATALGLLGEVLPGPLPQLPAGATITHVTLVVRAPALDTAPRGSGLLVAPGAGPVDAKALTHASAKWRWLAAATAPGEHVLRLSYHGGAGEVDRATADASRLLGAPIEEVLDAAVVVRAGALSPTTPAHRSAVADLRNRVAMLPGLAVTGSWVAGTGLGAVVPDGAATGTRTAQTTIAF
ncbi:protoporphyrinogen/coproporphyrinogen oxidase [Georgenia alba]|uniref:Protoporphyrinogen/coproporphyrinogen oxidase n=1 Tax=Georgenia alba TaxID=2233858 RepID=A0ABW2Q3R4_9MICO